MKKKDIVRALRDEQFLRSLSEEQRAEVPASAAGMIELSNAELGTTAGGDCTDLCTAGCTPFVNSWDCEECFTC